MLKKASLVAIGLLCASVAMEASEFEAKPIKIGDLSDVTLSSPHDYPAGDASFPIVFSERLEHPGATYLVVRFSRFELAPGDELVVRDPDSLRVHRYRDKSGALRAVPEVIARTLTPFDGKLDFGNPSWTPLWITIGVALVAVLVGLWWGNRWRQSERPRAMSQAMARRRAARRRAASGSSEDPAR